MLELQAGVPFRLGGMPVTIPVGMYGRVFTLDVLNLGNTDDSNGGMVLDFGFGFEDDPVTKWASAAQSPIVDDAITYAHGPLRLIVPEPTTLVILGVATCLGVARTARRARQRDIGTRPQKK